jgi:hypothetical protein
VAFKKVTAVANPSDLLEKSGAENLMNTRTARCVELERAPPWHAINTRSTIVNMLLKTSQFRGFAVVSSLLAVLAAGPVFAADPLPSLKSAELSQGPYSSMHMLLEKTILNVDVLTVDVRFGKQVQPKLAAIANGKQYSEALGKQLADVAIKADDAVVQLKFARDVSLNQWMDAVKENLQQAKDAGLISAKVQQKVSQGLAGWFAAVSERGYKKGDRVLYRVRADSLRTAVVTADGKVLVDRVDREADAPRVVMASYFAPGSDFRELLLKSFFKATN